MPREGEGRAGSRAHALKGKGTSHGAVGVVGHHSAILMSRP